MPEKQNTDRHAPEEVDAYISALEPEAAGTLRTMRQIILAVAPGVKQRVSYGIPIFRLKGDLVGISSGGSRVSFHVMSPKLCADLKSRYPGLKVSGATIHFQAGSEPDAGMLGTIIRERIAESSS